MSQEAVMIAVDNSDFMRNGDFTPTRLQAQNDAVNLLCQVKRQANPENTVGLISLANTEVLCTLTSDMSKIYNRLHLIQPKGGISFCTSIRIAHLALRHRQLRHQKMRIVCFIGSPIQDGEAEMVKLAKRLKKEKVNVDIINFGEHELNRDKLEKFIDTVNGKDGNSSHLVTVPPGTVLHESLASSAIIAGEGGAGAVAGSNLGLEFGLDAVDDPDLIYALRVSMEDQRMRQEQEASANPDAAQPTAVLPSATGTSEEELLRQALAMSMQDQGGAGSLGGPGPVDLASMTEEEQIAYAIQMSMQTEEQSRPAQTEEEKKSESEGKEGEGGNNSGVQQMEVDDVAPAAAGASGSVSGGGVSTADCDPEFLQSVLQYLPGVDPNNEEVRRAIESLTKDHADDKTKKKKDGDDGKMQE